MLKASKTDFKELSRALSLVENSVAGYRDILLGLQPNATPIIGITGPPGAGKSTLVNALLNYWSAQGKYIAVLAIDPTSPFNLGSLLGDRIRMAEQFTKPNVFIRSLATRGSLGGLSAKTIELADVLRSAGFDYILVETVGVGQSEVEIAGLADITLVVLVPEAGDEIQGIKSGLMEIADAFIVNKADREGADTFANTLKKLSQQKAEPVPVLSTLASKAKGIEELIAFIDHFKKTPSTKKQQLLAQKAWQLLQQKLTAGLNKEQLQQDLAEAVQKSEFNLYKFIDNWTSRS